MSAPTAPTEKEALRRLDILLANLRNVVQSWEANSGVPEGLITVESRTSFAALGADLDRAIDSVLMARLRSRLEEASR